MTEGLKRLPEVRLAKLPRMADFALWATACETALWPAGTFWLVYSGNRDEAVDGVIDADPVAAALRAVMAAQKEWTGTALDLLGALAEAAGERIAKGKTWPDGPRALAGRLRRAATFLRKLGIEISFKKIGRTRTRIIRVNTLPTRSAAENAGTRPSAPSAPSAVTLKSNAGNGFEGSDPRTVARSTDDTGEGPSVTVRADPLKSNGRSTADGADANHPLQSDPGKADAAVWRGRI